MPYTLTVKGLDAAVDRLNFKVTPALSAAAKAIANEVEDVIAPYPPATIANSPDNPMLRWYQRGWGPRWWVMNTTVGGVKTSLGTREWLTARSRREHNRQAQGYAFRGISQATVSAQERKGRIHGNQTSQQLGQGWHVERVGPMAWQLVNRVSYAARLHSAQKQVRWAGRRGWITDKQAIETVQRSGVISKIVRDAIMARARKSAG